MPALSADTIQRPSDTDFMQEGAAMNTTEARAPDALYVLWAPTPSTQATPLQDSSEESVHRIHRCFRDLILGSYLAPGISSSTELAQGRKPRRERKALEEADFNS